MSPTKDGSKDTMNPEGSAMADSSDMLRIPELPEDVGTLTAAFEYAKAGWYVLPVRRGDYKNPGSFVGKNWPAKSSRDPEQLVEWFAGTDHGIALHLGRSGAVALDVDNPAELPPLLVGAFHVYPPPMQRTRREGVEGYEPNRGHYLYLQPSGRTISNSKGDLKGPWGDVRGRNGVIIVAPSVHAKADAGGFYSWARTGDVPEMPSMLADALPDAADSADAVTSAEIHAFVTRHTEASRPELLDRKLKSLAAKYEGGDSRHTSTVAYSIGVLTEAACGFYPAERAVERLKDLFVAAATSAKPGDSGAEIRTQRQAENEFASILSYAVAQAANADLDKAKQGITERIASRDPFGGVYEKATAAVATASTSSAEGADDSTPAMAAQDFFDGLLPPETVAAAMANGSTPAMAAHELSDRNLVDPAMAASRPPTNLPDDFWESRPVLAHIRQAARSRRVAPDAVLGAVLARLAAMAHPSLQLNTGVSTPGSLNLITALVGASGSGKSSAKNVARELVSEPAWLTGDVFRDGLPLGSGEGLVEAYFGTVQQPTEETWKSGPRKGEPKTEPVRAQVRANAFFYQDEGAALTKMLERSGATIATMLRSAWSGELIGQANARVETTRVLQPGTYSLGLAIGYQPGSAQALLTSEQVDGGTPQRFVFLSAIDPEAPDLAPEHPGQLDSEMMLGEYTDDVYTLSNGGEPRTGLVVFPASVRAELDTRRLAGLRGQRADDEMDSHVPLIRAKLSVLLALLDCRGEVTEDDWRLSGVLWDTSSALRDWLILHGQEEQERIADAASDAYVDRTVRVEVARSQAANRIEHLARRLRTKVEERGSQTRREARQLLAGRERALYQEALMYAIGRGWLTEDEDTGKVGLGAAQPPGKS